MKTKHFIFFFSFILTAVMIIGCGRGKGVNAITSEAGKRVAEQAEQQAKWERYVAYVDSVRRVDHSVDAYLRSAWICHGQEKYAQALRYTDTALVLITDSIPLATINNTRYLRSLCFDRMGKTESSISEMKAIIASDDPDDPAFTHESRLNLAHYYLKLKRYDEALAALPDSISEGGRQLYKEILKAKANIR